MKCPHCGSKNLSKPYTDTFPENGTDDPQYSGGLIEIILALTANVKLPFFNRSN